MIGLPNRGLPWPENALGLAMILVGVAGLAAGSRGGERAAPLPAASEAQSAARPGFLNAQVETRAAVSLSEDVRKWAEAAGDPAWLGYSVPAIDGEHSVCCGGNSGFAGRGSCGTCRLEDDRHKAGSRSDDRNVNLEGRRDLVVLVRAAGRKIGRIQIASGDCTLDAGGLRVVWLSGVKPEESVALLGSYVNEGEFRKGDRDQPGNGALTAIALHAGAAAGRLLESFTRADRPEELRSEAAFWLGSARGAEGETELVRMARNDPSTRVRSQVTFALSLNPEPAALEEMIRMAREDQSTEVRGQALFWLAQKAGRKASGAITGAIENDPDTEVKKKAVFALSQMPEAEGVPKLIEVAQRNRNPEVRKQAMFWLGQTHDPRALEFFESVLAK